MEKAILFSCAGVNDYYVFTAVAISSFIRSNPRFDGDIIWQMDDLSKQEDYKWLPSVIFAPMPRLGKVHKFVDIEKAKLINGDDYFDNYHDYCGSNVLGSIERRFDYDRILAMDSDTLVRS